MYAAFIMIFYQGISLPHIHTLFLLKNFLTGVNKWCQNNY
jgi:hypothetical protein